MRKVKIFKREINYGYDSMGTQYVESREYSDTGVRGYFHQWAITTHADHSPFSYAEVTAIVELEDGKIELFNFDEIQFIKEESE